MSSPPSPSPTRPRARRTRSGLPAAALALSAVLVGVVGLVGERAIGSSSTSATSSGASAAASSADGPSEPAGSAGAVAPIEVPSRGPGAHADQLADRPPEDLPRLGDSDGVEPSTRTHATGRLGVDDGLVPDGVTVFDDGYPAVARLDPALLGALRRAATDAAQDHVKVLVNSGWRSPAYQEELLEEAVSKYGSREKAARWVAPPERSEHVSGHAVDVGPSKAASWLSKHGARYGLCRTYRNEPWHYELRPAAPEHGCPPEYADPAHDPRMQS